MNDPREAWITAALRSRADQAQSRSDCPHPERIWDAVRLHVPLDERLAVIDHLSECPTCTEAWELAAELAPMSDQEPLRSHENAFQVPQVTSPASSPAASAFAFSAFPTRLLYGRNVWLIGAAPVLMLLGIGLMMFRQTDQPTQSSLPQEELVLRWTPGPTGSRYDVTVMTLDKNVVADVRNLEDVAYRVPKERLAGLANDTELLWRVVARTPEGSTVLVLSDLLRVRRDTIEQTDSITIDLPKAPIALNAIPWAQVWVDGVRVGETPIGSVLVSIGPHEVVFRHPELGEKRVVVIATLPGPIKVGVDMSKK